TGDSVVALTCAGALVALGAATGQRRWTAQLGDPSTRWCWGGALLHGDAVFAGTAACFGAYSLADGELRWVRDDLAAEDWMPAPGRPVAAGDAIVVAFRNARAHLCALDARTGRVRWCMRGNELTAPSSGPAAADGVVVTATIDGWL